MPTSHPMDPVSHRDAQICRGCWDQMHVPIPIRGALALPFRMFGVTRSKMNPNICTICERSFRYVKKQRHVTATATILFADIRGFTALSEQIEPIRLSEIVSLFHDRCAQAIWAHDGIEADGRWLDGDLQFSDPEKGSCRRRGYGGARHTATLHRGIRKP